MLNKGFYFINTFQLSPLVDVLKDVLEATVIALEDSVLGAHVQWPLLLDGVLEARVGEASDRLKEKRANETQYLYVMYVISESI